MDRDIYQTIEGYMLACMRDSAHDPEHIYRVLYAALDIVRFEPEADADILVAACLLHDIGREQEYRDPSVCHAQAGSEMAYSFLIGIGYPQEGAAHVRACILTHRYRGGSAPASIEAKILFDADKLDAAGCMGIARTLLYQGKVSEPLYTLDAGGAVLDGSGGGAPSFFAEYQHKLKNLYGQFYTARGRELAQGRQAAAASFYESLLAEVKPVYECGRELLLGCLGQR